MIGQDFTQLRQRMQATGIGFAGIEGAWWLPAAEPFALPGAAAEQLNQIGPALFALFDAVTGLYGTPAGQAAGLDALLNHKVPASIPRRRSPGQVDSVRPDFQLVVQTSGVFKTPEVSLVATELEICPSAHGFAHAMQVGYGLPTDLVQSFARYLRGRELLFAGTHQWSEFLYEQLAFCRALAQIGARGRVLYDRPIATLADEVRRGQRWQPPLFGIKEKPAQWQTDVYGFIRRHGLEPFLWPHEAVWPADVAEAVIFRFGYFDCFAPPELQYFWQWQTHGATLLNPAMFILDSKVSMAALGLKLVRERIAAINSQALPVLDRCIPETLLLHPETLDRLMAEQESWVVKFAGFDGGNQAWGGRSLQVGAEHHPASWRERLQQCLALPWPVIAQRLTPSAQVDIAFLDASNQVQVLPQGATRLRTFFLRDGATAVACGSHLTVSGSTVQVSEATDTVQAPIVFQDS
jgi:hypothetical protein